jgi:hypothetical protein
MKNLTTILLLITSLCAVGQTSNFKDLQDYTVWMMNYYKNPEPQFLFEGFRYGVQSKAIANAGSRNLVVSFFSSCFRNDTVRQNALFREVEQSSHEDFIRGFGLTLWYIHSEYSLNKFQQFADLKQFQKYKDDFEALKKQKYTNLWIDPIIDPSHLDMLWADFFATGNGKSVEKIITKLADLDSKDSFQQTIAGSAMWSLTSNAIHHDKVFDVCKTQIETADQKTKGYLKEIVKEAKKQRGG